MDKCAISKIDPEAVKVLENLVITPEESAIQQVTVIGGLTKGSNGKFHSYEATVTSW